MATGVLPGELPGPRDKAGQRRILWAGLALLLGAVALAAAWLQVSLANTLRENGRWVSTKAQLEMGVMGAGAFVNSRQSLAGGVLDLGRWHGFQEVLVREPLNARAVGFDFWLSPGSYLCFVCDADAEGFTGLRLSAAPEWPGLAFRASPEGAFLERQEVATATLPAEEWLHAEARYEGGSVALEVAGVPFGRCTTRDSAARRFGFRAGLREVRVDEVSARGAAGERLLSESFFDRRALLGPFLGWYASLAALSGLASYLLRRLGWSGRRARAPLLALTLGLALASAAGAFAYQRFFSRTYPTFDRGALKTGVAEEARALGRELAEQHGGARAPGLVRLVFLGTSQTWGAGAARREQTFVARIEQRLNAAAPPGRRYECVNAGVQGARSPNLAELWQEALVALAPDLLVVDLGNNDDDAEALARALDSIAASSAARGIPVLLALEANSSEKRAGELAMHPVLRAAAERHGLALVDLHAALLERRDTGFLWWDFVHPTSYGHRLIAEALLPAIRAVLEP